MRRASSGRATHRIVATVLAAGGTPASGAGGDDSWDAGALAALDVPVLQGLCLTTSRAAWSASDAGLSPMDAAMQVAIPEFDGRIVTVPFSFKEIEAGDDIPVYRAEPERTARHHRQRGFACMTAAAAAGAAPAVHYADRNRRTVGGELWLPRID